MLLKIKFEPPLEEAADDGDDNRPVVPTTPLLQVQEKLNALSLEEDAKSKTRRDPDGIDKDDTPLTFSTETLFDNTTCSFLIEILQDEEGDVGSQSLSLNGKKKLAQRTSHGPDLIQDFRTAEGTVDRTVSHPRVATAATVSFDKDEAESTSTVSSKYNEKQFQAKSCDADPSIFVSPGKCAADECWSIEENLLLKEALKDKTIQDSFPF